MTQGLPVSDVVKVAINLTPLAAATRNFGSLLLVSISNVIDVKERLRLYTSLDDIATDHGTNSGTYLAAALYFSQSPQPSQVYVGRRAQSKTTGILHGGVLSTSQQNLNNFTAVTAGGFKVTIDGVLKNLSGVNLSSATNLNGVAMLITTALGGAGVCTWDAIRARFDIASATTGDTSTITAATAPDSGQANLANVLHITSTLGAYTVDGINAETLTAAVQILATMSSDWYGVYCAEGPQDDALVDLAGFIEGASPVRILGCTDSNPNALDPLDTASLAAKLAAGGFKRTFCQYSSNFYAGVSVFGRAFTVDFNGSNTTLTLKFKTEPGVTPDALTSTQMAALKAKNCNAYVAYQNGTAILQEGVMANGFFFDEVHGTDWLQNDVQTAVFNLLYTSETKVPQTDAGINQILTTIEHRLAQAVANGMVAPGVWTAGGFGGLKTGDTLGKGYYVYAPPVASQSAADRQARKAPVIQAAIKLAGAVHSVNTIISVNR